MKFSYDTVSKIIAVFLMASIIPLGYYYYLMGAADILSYLIPAIITTVIFLFYFFSGFGLIRKPLDKTYIGMCTAALFLQTIQIQFLGFTFKNYYGPYIGVGLKDTPDLEFLGKFELISFLAGNGFGSDDRIYFVINIFTLALLFLFGISSKKERERIDGAFAN